MILYDCKLLIFVLETKCHHFITLCSKSNFCPNITFLISLVKSLEFLDKIWTLGIVCTALEERHFRVPLITLNGCDAVSLMDMVTLCVKELQRLITMTHCIFWPENQSKIVSKYGLKN